MKKLLNLTQEHISGQVIKRHIENIAQFHRIQASPGYRQAAQYCLQTLQGAGVEAQIHSYPAREDASYWTFTAFQEWDASEAWCYLIEPEEAHSKLADFRENPISLIQRSAPFEGEAEVILLEDGEELNDYQDLDVKGKLVLTKGDVRRVHQLAVEKFGAIGILYDGMRPAPPVRERIDLPDARQYTSFWWSRGDKKCFGFVLTPRQGEKLRQYLKEGKPVKVRARVSSRFYEGSFEVVEARIPGQADEWVLVIAHLCHPAPSANDNASGAATALEVAITLHKLIEEGRLPRPRRGIRFLWVPEMSGTYAYLSRNEELISKLVAGLNLDMVGQDQEKCSSVLLLESPPAVMASFAPFVLEWMLESMSVETKTFSGTGGFPLFRYALSPFSGGSDHYILSDPTVGVPTPMIIQWPDRFYHTDQDTPEKTDPRMLKRVGTLAASYAYFVASASADEVTELGYEMLSRLEGKLSRIMSEALPSLWEAANAEELAAALAKAQSRLKFWGRAMEKALSSLRRLWPQGEEFINGLRIPLKAHLDALLERLSEAAEHRARSLGVGRLPPPPPEKPNPAMEEVERLVPRRLHRGPPADLSQRLKALSEEDQERWHKISKEYRRFRYVLPVLALYWADGKRSLGEIFRLIELETGLSAPEYLLEYFRFLEKMGLVELLCK